ncbi:MAG: hypothetical protein J6W22_12360 [Fibrobacter sp.]|nr:hypothetical protein [Fibrobacter sp.]
MATTKIAKKKVSAKALNEKIIQVPPKRKKKKVFGPKIGGIRVLDSVAKKADVLLKSIDSFKVKNPGTAGLPVLEKALKSVSKDVSKFKATAEKVAKKAK